LGLKQQIFSFINTSSKYIATDSRTVAFPSETIFFASKGSHNNGHLFIKDLFKKGVREFVVEKDHCPAEILLFLEEQPHVSYWIVENALWALQQLCATHREKFQIPIVAITGSNGKTIVKEWLSNMLSGEYKVCKSPKSYNSQLGVALSAWGLSDTDQIGVFEAGISQPGEMLRLQNILKPTIGIFTNLGQAHAINFFNWQEHLSEKLSLFKNVEFLVLENTNDNQFDFLVNYLKITNQNIKLIDWGYAKGSFLVNSIKHKNHTTLSFLYNAKEYSIHVAFTDAASIQNCIHCIVFMSWFGLDWDLIVKKVNGLMPVPMRLELKEGINQSLLIDDSYNNDLNGLALALDFMNQQEQRKHKVLIFSDYAGLESTNNDLFEFIKLVEVNQLDTILLIGPKFIRLKEFLPKHFIFFRSTNELLEALNNSIHFKEALILIKGSRHYGFESVVNFLQSKSHRTLFEINLDSLTHNFNFFRSKLKPNTRVMAMVKAMAYGAGNAEIAHLLQYHGVDYLGVAYADEGVFLRERGISTPIMVMNPNLDDWSRLRNHNLEPEIYSLRLLENYLEFVADTDTLSKIHLKFDTGMHRLGFMESELPHCLALLKANPQVLISSVFTHLVASESDSHTEFTHQQITLFNTMFIDLCNTIGYKPIRHVLNTTGISRFPEYHFEMVRLGIGLYGVGNINSETSSLHTVSSLKTRISQIKFIEKGETVGYGRRGVLLKNSKIATVSIGYADGYPRAFGLGVGKMLVNNVLCPTVGSICMDMCMLDVTGVAVQEGDEVIVFGTEPSVYSLAKDTNTIPYEILTNIGQRVKRVFIKE
jgi:Alr-MurF fusion protein